MKTPKKVCLALALAGFVAPVWAVGGGSNPQCTTPTWPVVSYPFGRAYLDDRAPNTCIGANPNFGMVLLNWNSNASCTGTTLQKYSVDVTVEYYADGAEASTCGSFKVTRSYTSEGAVSDLKFDASDFDLEPLYHMCTTRDPETIAVGPGTGGPDPRDIFGSAKAKALNPAPHASNKSQNNPFSDVINIVVEGCASPI